MNAPTGEEKLLAALCHASAFFFPILIPLIVYLLKRDSLFVRNHAREALVFHLFMIIAIFLCKLLFIVLIGFLLIVIAAMFYFITTIRDPVPFRRGISVSHHRPMDPKPVKGFYRFTGG